MHLPLWSVFYLFLASVSLAHDFHVSKGLIDYNAESRSLQISLHLFIDDLEAALREHGADQLFLGTKQEHPKGEQYVARYLGQNVRLEVNGSTVEPQFLGKETSEDLQAIWCYLEVPGITDLQRLTVTNTLLLDQFDDQQNLVHVIGPGEKQKLLLFDRKTRSRTIQF